MARWIRITLAALAAFAWLPGCSTNPATGRAQFNAISEEREISLGNQSAPEFKQQLRRLEDNLTN